MAAIAVSLVLLGGSSAAVGDPPDLIGDWSAPSAWPIVAVHMSLTPTGEVFSLDGFGPAVNSERLWNPTTNTFRGVPYGRNLFCSGHIQLSDGRTLIVGGHVTSFVGLKDTTLFNAQTSTYFRGADMAEARWYPTVTQLPDGRVLTFAGDRIVYDRPGQLPPLTDASINSLPEIYNPDDEHVDQPPERAAHDAALSTSVRPLGWPDSRRRSGSHYARVYPRHLDVVDHWHESL